MTKRAKKHIWNQKYLYLVITEFILGMVFTLSSHANSEVSKILSRFDYNEQGNIIKQEDSGGLSSNVYYKKSKIYASTLRNNYTTCIYYNDIGELLAERTLNQGLSYKNCPETDQSSGASVLSNYNVTYNYNKDIGELTSLTDSTGTTVYHYYPSGQIKSIIYPDNKSIKYSYDLQRSLSVIIDADNNKTIYHKNNKGQLETVDYWYQGAYNQIQYKYDGFGHIENIIEPSLTITFNYDQYDRVKKIKYLLPDSSVIIINDTYNPHDNYLKTRIVTTPRGVSNELFTYNTMGKLSTYSCSSSVNIDKNICPRDKVGNIIKSQLYSFDKYNNIEAVTESFIDPITLGNGNNTVTYHYDNITYPTRLTSYSNTDIINYSNSKTLSYNSLGDVISDDQGKTYTYNPFGLMLSSSDANGHNIATYVYNGNNTLMGETLIKNGKPDTLNFYYANQKLINQFSSGKMISYLLGPNKLARFTSNGAEYFIFNQDNSVIGMSSSEGRIEEQYVYSPYGISFSLGNLKSDSNTIGFNGERTDPATGYQFLGNGYRAYNPFLRRFMQPDSNSPFGAGGINGYSFSNNNPIMYTDPSGHFPVFAFSANIAASLVSIAGAIAAPFTEGSSLALGLAIASSIVAAASDAAAADFVVTKDKKAMIASDVLMGVSAVGFVFNAAVEEAVGAKIISGISEQGAEDTGKTIGSAINKNIAAESSACFTAETPVLVQKEIKEKICKKEKCVSIKTYSNKEEISKITLGTFVLVQ